jgi:RHS repeat-associated protein
MARTAPVPNIPAIPGMNPGVFVMGGGGGTGSGRGDGSGSGNGQGGSGENGGSNANGGGKSACGAPGQDGGGCPNHHGGPNSGKVAQGDPVDVATGRVFTTPVVDLFLRGPLPLEFARTYSSFARDRDQGLGRGFSHTFSWAFEERRRGCRVFAADGERIDFELIPTQGDAVLGPSGLLLHREGDACVLEFTSGIRRTFEREAVGSEQRFRLMSVEDRHRNRIQLRWERGKLAAILDSVGRTVVLRSGPQGRIAEMEVITASGRSFWFARYAYDVAGRLVAVTDADGHTTRYEYDERDLLRSQEGPTGVTYYYRYDDAGRCVETWGQLPGDAGDLLGTSVPSVLSDGRTRARGIHHFCFDYGGDGYTEIVDPVTSHRYISNAQGKAEKAVIAGRVFTRTYDERGNLVLFTDPTMATTRWERDIRGFETRIVDPLGRETRIERLPNGDILKITDPEGDVTEVSYAPAQMIWVDSIGACFEIRYEARGMVEETIAPDGRRTRYRHDRDGNLIEVATEQGARFRATYDELGRRLSISDAKEEVTHFTWSPAGRLLAITAPDGSTERARYDGRGALVAVTDALGRTTELRRGGSGVITDVVLPDGRTLALRYDRLERLVELRNPRGERYTIDYDSFGMPVKEQTFDGRTIRSTYDAAGRLIRVDQGPGTRVEVERDAVGQVRKRVDNDDREERFEYNGRGELIRAESDIGVFRFERNALGWVTRQVQDAFGKAIEIETEYDRLGALSRRSTSLGHVMTWRRDFEKRSAEVTLDGSECVTLTYDAAGLEVERKLAGGARVQCWYDALQRLVHRRLYAGQGSSHPGEPAWVGAHEPGLLVDQHWEYTAAGDVAIAWDAERGATWFTYDALSQLLAASPERARATLFVYDETGNMREAGERGPARRYEGDRLVERGAVRYRYDEQGRLIEKVEGASASEGAARRSTTYAWSPRGELMEVRRPDGAVVRFAYDPLSRRVLKTLWQPDPDGQFRLTQTTRFVWDGADLVHEIHAADGITRARTYAFDGTGAPLAHRDAERRDGGAHAGPWLHYLNDLTGCPERLVQGDGRVVGVLRKDPWGLAEPSGGKAVTPLRFAGHYADEETGLHYNWHRYYDPETGRYLSPDPLEIEGELNPFRYALNRPTCVVDPTGLIYSRIVDSQGKILYDGKNPGEGGNVPPPGHISGKPCAEAQALTLMASDIRTQVSAEQKKTPMQNRLNEQQIDEEVNARIKKRFHEENLSIETFDNAHDAKKNKNRVDPCSKCGQMFEKLGITDCVVGKKGNRGEYGVYKG